VPPFVRAGQVEPRRVVVESAIAFPATSTTGPRLVDRCGRPDTGMEGVEVDAFAFVEVDGTAEVSAEAGDHRIHLL
jgi:hypothetical protein